MIDGGSTDGTVEIIERYRDRLACFVPRQDGGLYDALNKGVGQSHGDIVGILHADDRFADGRVLEDVAATLNDSNCDAVYGDLEFVDGHDPERVTRRWKAGPVSRAGLYTGWMPPHPTFFVRRECYEKYGLYRLDLGTAADYELMLRFLLVHGIRAEYIPRVLVRMRTGGASNASLGARWRANRMDRKAWEVNNLRPYPWTLLAKPMRKIGQWWLR